MTHQDAINFFHGASRLARALGCSPSTVASWADAGEIPEGRQYQLELATGGRLRADLPALRTPVEELAKHGVIVGPPVIVANQAVTA